MTTLRTVTETAADLGRDARRSMEELSRSAGKKLDEARDETAGVLHTAADSVRATGHQGSRAIDDLAIGAADRLDATASYVEDHDPRELINALYRFGRRHPAGSLMAAVAVGFVAGSVLSRATNPVGKRA